LHNPLLLAGEAKAPTLTGEGEKGKILKDGLDDILTLTQTGIVPCRQRCPTEGPRCGALQ